MLKVIKNKLKYFILMFAVAIMLLTAFCSTPLSVTYAANTDVKFDDTNVLDDLQTSTVNGKAFSILNYPFDSTGELKHPEIINFVEYCYSYKVNMQSNYGLYLYFYNPQSLNIATSSRSNKVQLAVSYNADGLPNGYEKFDLQFCSKVEESKYKNLFYKFKIVDHVGADGKTILQRVNSNGRRYDISGVELHTFGASNATEYTVGGTYTFSGYVKGYGADSNAESDLTCDVNNLETVELAVHNTFYRTSSSSLGKYYQNELNSVYFSVDNALIKKYGKLQKILAEWWEYKTTPIIVTSEQAVCAGMQNYLGKVITDASGVDKTIPYGFRHQLESGGSSDIIYDWSYNGYNANNTINSRYREKSLNYIFDTNGTNVFDYTLSSYDLANYIYNYDKSFVNGTLPIKNQTISADLFSSDVDTGRIRGYNKKEFDTNDSFDMLAYDSTHNGWDKFWDYFGNWGVDTNSGFNGLSPIYKVVDSDFTGDVSNTLCINNGEVDAFKEYYNLSKSQDKTTYLFRFGKTDYYSIPLETTNFGREISSNKAYMAKETVFLDFDIIQLTFNSDGIYTVIPVVSSPIDIINDITPPAVANNDWFKLILMVILFLILLIILMPLLPLIIRFIVWVIKLMFNIFAFPFKLISKSVKKNKTKGVGKSEK